MVYLVVLYFDVLLSIGLTLHYLIVADVLYRLIKVFQQLPITPPQ